MTFHGGGILDDNTAPSIRRKKQSDDVVQANKLRHVRKRLSDWKHAREIDEIYDDEIDYEI